jgi:hypothetical protein
MLTMAPSGAPGAASAVELDENTHYLTPERRFVTEYLFDLTNRAYEYLHLGEPGEPLLEAFQVVKQRVDDFEHNKYPDILETFVNERNDFPEDEYPKQVLYLLNKGLNMYREGIAQFESFIASGDEPTLIESVTKMQDANDNLCLAYQLVGLRNKGLEEDLRKHEVMARHAAMTGAGSAEAPPEAPAAEASED